jgi:hypothetical protein
MLLLENQNQFRRLPRGLLSAVSRPIPKREIDGNKSHPDGGKNAPGFRGRPDQLAKPQSQPGCEGNFAGRLDESIRLSRRENLAPPFGGSLPQSLASQPGFEFVVAHLISS